MYISLITYTEELLGNEASIIWNSMTRKMMAQKGET